MSFFSFAQPESRRRWSDNDKHFGPFTYSYSSFRHIAVMLSSADEEYPGCSLRISVGPHTLIVYLPQLIKPYAEKVTARYWDAAAIERMGRDWYWQIDRREYGFSIHEGHFNVKFGRQTYDSSTTKDWGCFLPWTQWRFVRHSLYDTTGAHFWTEPRQKKGEPYDFSAWHKASEACPSLSFDFEDFDGERLVATTKIEEREWKFGEGWFKWLSLFRRNMVRRSLDIQFSGETGRRKGSWKGGTVGHSIEMLPGELHEAAFRRYCEQNDMKFIGPSA